MCELPYTKDMNRKLASLGIGIFSRGYTTNGYTAERSLSDNTKEKPTVIGIRDDNHFSEVLRSHCRRLVVVDYTAEGCGPCRLIAPHIEKFATKYPQVTFLEVNVDQCGNTAASQKIQSMPTFIFYWNMKPVNRHEGVQKNNLETKIQNQLAEPEDEVDLLRSFLVKNECECLNDGRNHNFAQFLDDTGQCLESASNDPRLSMSFTFTQPVSLYSLRVKAPATNGPKTIKLNIDRANAINFKDAANEETQWKRILHLEPTDLEGGSMNLMCSTFQLVQRLQIFVESNQSAPGETTTRIDSLVVVGAPLADQVTNITASHEQPHRGTLGHFLSEMTMATKWPRFAPPTIPTFGKELGASVSTSMSGMKKLFQDMFIDTSLPHHGLSLSNPRFVHFKKKLPILAESKDNRSI